MRLNVLGCAAGIGGREQLTTCLRLDHDILLDAGTGLGSLGIDQLIQIDHVFLSHCHLDHVAGLALLLDTVMGRRSHPITLHASDSVLAALTSYLFNWSLWPDFTRIPSASAPLLKLEPMAAGATVVLGSRSITSFRVEHTVDACAYWVHNDRRGILFTGDMASTPELWAAFRDEPKLANVIVDCSFPNAESDIANLSKHFCPRTLIDDIRSMPKQIEFFVYHLKPGQEEQIMEELRAGDELRRFTALRREDWFEF
jgi:3',5'-cyclic-nucleotide phosphodiesterase